MKIYISESAVPLKVISRQEAEDRKLFGPVYHGSPRMETILEQGFDLKHVVPVSPVRTRLASVADLLDGLSPPSDTSAVGPSHGYPFSEYYSGCGVPPPIHHLGFGIYFTTVKNIGKKFNHNSVKNLKEFYLDVPRVEEINFGAPHRMMSWWKSHGYNISPTILAARDHNAWVRATGKLTQTLRNMFDAVWFKGKGMYKLLDGDQIVVFDPKKIYLLDSSLAVGLDLGATVTHTQNTDSAISRYTFYQKDHEFLVMPYRDAINLSDLLKSVYSKFIPTKGDWTAIVKSTGNNDYSIVHVFPPKTMTGTIVTKTPTPSGNNFYTIKWKKGGTEYNYTDEELEPTKK
jgi:hypothetical protein